MSRTFRRKGDKKRFKSGRSHFEKSYTHDRDAPKDLIFCGIRSLRSIKLVPMTCKDFWKGYWKFHGDSIKCWGNYKYTRQHFENKCRMKNNQEIARFIKNVDYDPLLYKPGCLSYER
jgi:hypothetical protein